MPWKDNFPPAAIFFLLAFGQPQVVPSHLHSRPDNKETAAVR